jgi:signal transduction histidine kinase/CheY-like chemotaxis protein
METLFNAFNPSVYRNDPDSIRRSRLLNILLFEIQVIVVLGLICILIAQLWNVNLWEQYRVIVFGAAAYSVLTIALYRLNLRGKRVMASYIYLLVITAIIAIADHGNLNVVFFVIPIVVASVLIKPEASYHFAAIISILFLALIILLDLSPKAYILPGAILLVAAVTWLTARNIDQAIQSTREMNEELERRVQLRTKELEMAMEQARAANQAKSAFLANMSHELRTPLNSIIGFSEIIMAEPDTPSDIDERVKIIRESGEHLLALINSVLDITKIEADRLELVPKTFNLPALLLNVTEIMQPEAKKKGLAFNYDVGTLPLWVSLDDTRLTQVLLNLLSNAIKFTENGEITLRVTSKVAGKKAHLTFSVTDTGVGISDEDQMKLFTPFSQVCDKKQKNNGTGLGLALSQRLVTLMGGEIKIKSELGSGSTFSFSISVPIGDERISELGTWSTFRNQPIGYCGPKRAALVVDDDADNRSMLSSMLLELGFAVSEAEDGLVAISRVRQHDPELIFMDIKMPVMDGSTAIRQIRGMGFEGTIITTSASPLDDAASHRSINLGVDANLQKPIKYQTLISMIEELIPIEWIFRPPEDASMNETLSFAVYPSPETLCEMEALLDVGDLMGVKKIVDGLEQSAYPEFKAEMSILLAEYDEDRIRISLKGSQ